MRRLPTMVLWLACCGALLTACADSRDRPPPTVVTKVEVVREKIPEAFLYCPEIPLAPAAGTQRTVALYVIALDAAARRCRKSLERVRLWQEIPPAP